MTQRVLVLGANGFIGKRVIHALRSCEWATPIAASRRPFADRDVESIQLDATQRDSLQQACNDVSSVINCITGDKDTIINSARQLFEMTANCTPTIRVVHLSTMAVYGSATGTVTESSSFSADLGAYAEAKIAVEMLATHYTNVVCLRPGIVYGPESNWWSDRIARLLLAKRLGNLDVHGTGICNLVYVDDVAQAALAAVQLSDIEDRVFNLANPVSITWNDYFRLYASALGVNPFPAISPLKLWIELNLLAVPHKIGELIEGKKILKTWHPVPAIRPWLTTLCQHQIMLDSSRASQRLGMHWTSLETGLRETAQWFINGGRV